MSCRIRVLTLNCWGVPAPLFGAKLRKERMRAIGQELAKGEYDVVMLQEIWSEADYDILCAKILTTLPHTHYFYSGVLGSGLCVFSKYPIQETHAFSFTLNGYPHKVFHGDWYGRKCVGLAKIFIHDFRINFYLTHLHADYHNANHMYDGHRIAQAFEMSQYIRLTGEDCDAVIVGGDFNYREDETGYKVILNNAQLSDSWLSQRKNVATDETGATCDRHDNSFTSPHWQRDQYPGQRIDYLLYRHNSGVSMDCDSCRVTMRKVPGLEYNFSDHEAVAADYIIRKNITAMGRQRNYAEVEKQLTDILEVIDEGMRRVTSHRVSFMLAAFFCLVGLVFSCDLTVSWTIGGATMGVVRTLLTVAIAVFLWMVAINSKVELASFRAVRCDVNNLIKSNPG